MRKIKALRFVIIGLLAWFLWSGCMPSPYYQSTVTLPKYTWDNSFKPSFTFNISDTQSHYNLYFIIRHTNAYPFSNIWMQIKTQFPDSAKRELTRLEIPLAEPTGKWLGRGMNEIWEQRMPLTKDNKPMIFQQAGKYTLTLQQDMRMNPLPEVLQVGIRLEKVDKIN